MPAVPVTTRLQTYSLEAAKIQSANLELAPLQKMLLNSETQTLGKNMFQLSPKSIDDLKKWMGVTDTAFVQPPGSVVHAVVVQPPPPSVLQTEAILPVHDVYTDSQTTTLYKLAQNYVFGHSASVSESQLPALNAWLQGIAPQIAVAVYADIHIGAGAQLVIGPSLPILFANHITIDRNGVLAMKATHSKIDCAGISGPATLTGPIHRQAILNP